MTKRKLFTLLTAALALTTLALAAPMIEIDEIVINRNMGGNGVEGLNIRVDVENVGTDTLEKPKVMLFSRTDWKSDWRLIKRWKIHQEIKPGQKLTHDYFAYTGGYVDPSLFAATFEVKAEVWADDKLVVKKTKEYTGQ